MVTRFEVSIAVNRRNSMTSGRGNVPGTGIVSA